MNPGCHVCHKGVLEVFEQYQDLKKVTSDCRSIDAKPKLGICSSCGTIQKIIDQDWENKTREIYEDYAIYHQGGGHEQRVFEESGNKTRSEKIVEVLKKSGKLSRDGTLLDIGCGNGTFLREFSIHYPEWQLDGLEWDGKLEEYLKNIRGFRALYTKSEHPEGSYSLISMIHTLEHLSSPQEYLKEKKKLLRPTGTLLIQVPNLNENPFDLLVVDHSTHYTPDTLSSLLRRTGYHIISLECPIKKELTAIAGSQISTGEEHEDPRDMKFSVQSMLSWLHQIRLLVRETKQPVAIFGTATAATWISQESPNNITLFVDEDPARIGRVFMGKRVVHPQDVPDETIIAPVLAPSIMKIIVPKLQAINKQILELPERY